MSIRPSMEQSQLLVYCKVEVSSLWFLYFLQLMEVELEYFGLLRDISFLNVRVRRIKDSSIAISGYGFRRLISLEIWSLLKFWNMELRSH